MLKFSIISAFITMTAMITFSIFISYFLTNSIMDNIVDMCIKIKIAQMNFNKNKVFQRVNKKVDFNSIFTVREFDKSEYYRNLDLLFYEIEYMLKIFQIMHFTLEESNSRDYNTRAWFKYNELKSVISRMIKRHRFSSKNISSAKSLRILNNLKILEAKCNNNIGWLMVYFGQYQDALFWFKRASMVIDKDSKY